MTTWKLREATYTVSMRHKFDHEENLVSEEIAGESLVAEYDVKDAPDLTSRYSKVVIRPDQVILEFSGDRFRNVDVYGQKVLKSGEPGKVRGRYYAPFSRNEWPDWLRELVEKAEQEIKEA